MTASRLTPLLHSLSRLEDLPTDDRSDVELLDRYCARRDEAAFALLVRRHGPTVLGVCRRVLGNAADADDAFQATFLVLLRRADSVRRTASLAGWLHGVAWRVAARARGRRVPVTPTGEVFARSDRDPVGEASYRELVAFLDEQIGRLPAKYRAALVLCGPGGRTCEQAARELGWPKSTLALRLARARELLREQLGRRGVAVPAALAGEARAVPVPALLTLETVRLAKRFSSGNVPASVAKLAEQAVKPLAKTRWLVALGLATALGVAAVAAGTLSKGTEARPDPAPADSPLAAAAPAPRTDREGMPLPAEALARVGSARLRHGRYLLGLDYSPDGTLLATCGGDEFVGRDRSLKVWDARTGRLAWQAAAELSDLHTDCPFSADGKMVVVLDGDTCRWFDARSGRPLQDRDFKLPDGSWDSRIGPHGAMLATHVGDQTGDLVVYDLPAGKERFRKAADGFHWQGVPAFSADGKTLAVTEVPGTPAAPGAPRVRLFDLPSGRRIGLFDIGGHFIPYGLSPDGTRLAAGKDGAVGGRVDVWRVSDGKLLHQFEPEVNSVAAVTFTPDGTSIVVGSHDLHAVRVDPATGKELGRYRTHPVSHCLAVTADGRRLAIGGHRGMISQWDLATGKRLEASAGLAAPRSLHFDAAGRVLQFWDDAVVNVDWRAGREVRRVRVPFEGWPHSVCLSPDLSRVAADHDIWDVASGQKTPAVSVPTDDWAVKAFSADGKKLYIADGRSPVCAWDVEHGKYVVGLDRKVRQAGALVVSADDRRLAFVEGSGDPQAKVRQEVITVLDLAARREFRRLLPPAGAEVAEQALSPNGDFLAAVGLKREGDPFTTEYGVLVVWDVRTGKECLCRADLPAPLTSLAISGDGRTVATGSAAGAVTLWEVATRLERHQFVGHQDSVPEITFSRDDKFLAAASNDAPIFVWDVEGRGDRPPSAVPFTAAEAADLWQALNDAKAPAAFAAIRQLLARPGPAVALLRDRLPPAGAIDEKRVRQLVRDLDADAFAARKQASADLEAVADRVAPVLREALDGKPSEEAKRQLRRLLDSTGTDAPGRRREVRAVEVAERIGTAEARQLLAAWAGGDKDALLTREAQAAGERLKAR